MARKLNTKFIAAVAALGVAGGTGLYFGPKLMRPSIAKLKAEGEAAVQKGDYETAAMVLGKAVNRNQTNIPLCIEWLDALDYNVRGDPDRFRELRQMQVRVLATDPRSVPVLHRVMAFQLNDVRGAPSDSTAVRNLVNTAQRILELSPGDVEAEKALITAVLEPYSRNLEVLPETVETQRKAAQALYEKNPADTEAMQMLVRFHLVAAQRSAQQADDQTTQTELDAARKIVDAAVAKSPRDATAWMTHFNVYGTLAVLTPNLKPQQQADFNTTARASLDKANQFADPKNGDSFLSIRQRWLRLRELINIKEAEEGYRKLLTELPDDRQPRIMLADFLDRQPARRDEAAAVLEKEWKPTHPLNAIESRQQAINEMIEKVRLCTIKLGAMEVVTDPAEREKRLKEVEKQYNDLQSIPEVTNAFKPALLRLEGGIELEKGHVADAINSLDQALKLLNPDSPYSLEQDMRNDVLLQYAQAQLRLGQTGSARPKLVELVQRRPDNLIARATLADLLIRERNFNDAQQQVEFLKKVIPNNPVIERMNVRLLTLRSEALRDHYKDMPETTRDQRVLKLQAAGALGQLDEVTRLAKLMLQADPGDVEAAVVLADVQVRSGHRDEAVATIDAIKRVKPDDARVKNAQATLAAQTPEEQLKAAQERIAAISDPLENALATANFAQQQGKLDDAIAAYKKATDLKPADPRAYEALFRLALSRGKWSDAEGLLPKLTELNVDQTGGQIRRIQLAAARASAETAADKREAGLKAAVDDAANLSQQFREIANASLLYAQLLQQTGDIAGAADQYSATLDKEPTNIDALIGSVQCMFGLNRITEARARLDQANRIAPEDPRLRQLNLGYDLQYGDPQQAITALQNAVNADPKNPQAWGQLGAALDQIAQKKAMAKDEAGAREATQKAIDVLEKATTQFPDDLRFPVALAEDKRKLGDAAGAENVFAKLVATEKYKDSPQVVEMLAEQYSRSGKADDAERVLRDLIARTKPAPVSTVLKLSWLYAQLQRLPDALAVLDVRRDSPEVQRQRIQLLIASNNLDAARTATQEALATDQSADTYLLAAYVELRSNHLDKADGFLNKVFQLRPNDPAALFYRAQVKLNSSPPDLDGARNDLVKTRDLSPGNVEARLALADVLMRKQDRNGAISELQRAWKANSSSKAVLMRLADIYGSSKPPAWTSVENLLNEAKGNPQFANDPDVLLLAANMWVARNDSNKAIPLAKQALATSPNNADMQQRYFDLLLRARAYRDLLTESDPVLQQDRGAWWLYRLRGQALSRLDQRTEATHELDAAFNLVVAAGNERAIEIVTRTIADELKPKAAIDKIEPLAAKDVSFRLLLASLYQADGNGQAELNQLNQVMADRSKLRDDQLRQGLQMLGAYYLQSTPPDLKKARAAFEELLKQSPNDILVLNNLADVLSQPESGGTPEEALKYSQKAYDLASAYGQNEMTLYVWDTHGWVLIKNKRMDEGLDLLRRAAETAQFPDVYLHLAQANLMTNNVDGATNALEDCKRILNLYRTRKQPVDPTLPPKVEQLSAEIAGRRNAKATAG